MTPTAQIISVVADEDAAETLIKLRVGDMRQLPVMRNRATGWLAAPPQYRYVAAATV